MNLFGDKVDNLSVSFNLICWFKWDLVCHRRGKNKATATIFFIGVMLGAMCFGSLSDRFGFRF